MLLEDYLYFNRWTRVAFAKKLGISAPYLTHIISGRSRPSIKLARAVERETEGKIKWTEFIEQIEKKIDENTCHPDMT